MKTFLTSITLSCLCFLIACSIGLADPIQWQVNGHWYDVVEYPSTWGQSLVHAATRVHDGLKGHLATLTSQEENDFVTQSFVLGGNYWLGAFQGPRATAPDQGWRWITREPWVYTNWDATEPNDFGETTGQEPQFEDGEEGSLHILVNGLWNDLHRSGAGFNEGVGGYVVEYERRFSLTSAAPAMPKSNTSERQLSTTWAIIKRMY